ncbi:hypothetical protein G5B39_05805 [Rhodobacteraceae bacterium SC52]|nr:hypothetical protein G5B39_05805 [Rhodobacteraceae bacterium SC52]
MHKVLVTIGATTGLLLGLPLLSSAASAASFSASSSLTASATLSGAALPLVDIFDDSVGPLFDAFGVATAFADAGVIIDMVGLTGSGFSEVSGSASAPYGEAFATSDSFLTVDIFNDTGADLTFTLTYSMLADSFADYVGADLVGATYAGAYTYSEVGVYVENDAFDVLLDDFLLSESCAESFLPALMPCVAGETMQSDSQSLLGGVFTTTIADGEGRYIEFYSESFGTAFVTSVPVPAALPLLAAGLGALGLTRLRRRTADRRG